MTSIATSDDDVEMHSAISHIDGMATPASYPLAAPTKVEDLPLPAMVNGIVVNGMEATPTVMVEEAVASEPSLDLLDRIPGMFRLLDLVTEQGSNGLVDKILIAQDSVGRFANLIHPGSYLSEIQVDFHALDTHRIKPRGIYGSMSSIVDFLKDLKCIDNETASLLLFPRDEYSGVSRPTLRPGLYVLTSPAIEANIVYVIFWPEDGTWQDGAISSISRNRVTFMRYLTKLCDQLVCLISDEHSAQLVWKEESEEGQEDDALLSLEDRMFGFTVEQTKEQEEGAREEEGFTIRHSSIEEVTHAPPAYPEGMSLDILRSQLIVGETNQAILRAQFIPEDLKAAVVNESLKSLALRNRLSARMSPTIVFNESVDGETLQILLEKGDLWDRCGSLKSKWEAQIRSDLVKLDDDRRKEKFARRKAAEKDVKMLEANMPIWFIKQAAAIYPILSELALFQAVLSTHKDKANEDWLLAVAEVDSWFDHHVELKGSLIEKVRKDLKVLEINSRSRYIMLKKRIIRLSAFIGKENETGLTSKDVQELVSPDTGEQAFEEHISGIANPENATTAANSAATPEAPGIVSSIVSGVSGYLLGTKPRTEPIFESSRQDDIAFAEVLQTLVQENPVYEDAVNDLKPVMVDLLKPKIKKLATAIPPRLKEIVLKSVDDEVHREFDIRRQTEELAALNNLKEVVQERLAQSVPKDNNGIVLQIDFARQENKNGYGYVQDSFRLKGTLLMPTQAGVQYTLHSLDIRSDDLQAIVTNPSHICKPIIRPHVPQPFVLPLNCSLKYMRLLEKDRCLVVVEDATSFHVYLETTNSLSTAIACEKPIKRFHLEKVGREPLFAVDEGKKLFAMASICGESVLLHIYAYDLDSRSLGARGSTVNITKWFKTLPNITHICFVSGTEEVLIVEREGSCRIFSLVTENFRPASITVEGSVEAAFSSPDGACLFIKNITEEGCRIVCYHWASFGATDGIVIPWPEQIPVEAQMMVSSVGIRSSTHIIFTVPQDNFCGSLYVHITRKSSEFAFRSNFDNSESARNIKRTANNSLIDCHAEVWTRFPVQAPICRETNASAIHVPRTVTFVSSSPSAPFSAYFTKMIRDFEHKTRKPTKGVLAQLRVKSQNKWDPIKAKDATSELQAGDWLVGLFYLIPLHLAITGSNRFIPLKDGIISPQFEQTLLGANVSQIAESLTFGWYESIFNSYLATKPVKVVTSMGEQSVGKSFALNHFVDTSFAGSAMRCTEGVWLSVTPTRDYLVVAMDFEGVHSIERSAQEDTLLVLLNAAISNLVLFRNNFALSRDIAGLFTSFQSCTKVLDPAANPSLFHSTLGIIIKDVIDSDTREIVSEFQQKFQKIVQQERGENFISKLHRGRLDIIPWPVIESSRFYDLFVGLKNRFDRQRVTHKHAGSFLTVLKTLMAKLKANDWGALDQNLAAQRSQQIGSVLLLALSLGTTDPTTGEPLKNYDTDEQIANEDAPAQFYLEGVPLSPDDLLSVSDSLKKLRQSWPTRFERFSMGETEFILQYGNYLQGLVDARIKHVYTWMKANTTRFGENAEILALFRTFDMHSKELLKSVQLCGSKCSSCGLLCLDHKQHEGMHNCMTSHKCPEACGFADQHEKGDVPACDLPAGHTDRHACSGTAHICGAPCQLSGREGCLHLCTKPLLHDETEGHLCAGGVHTCGEPCGLVKNGTRLCSRPCVIDCRREHERHSCDRALSCPMKCQLCNSFCAVGDHFHALDKDAVHLCGQKHACANLCEHPGICEIATKPQSIESTFVGRHAKFQYTKYTQEARRLPCIMTIEADKLTHEGTHVHSREEGLFHYCETRCKHCGYYCTMPLDHRQTEHETSHGSMEHSEWVIEGDDDAILEVQGHKYASGDSGAPMLCSMLCKTLGRHVHVDSCRPDDEGVCSGAGVQHMEAPGSKQDWITHRLFWARSGFKDPYTQAEQTDFDLCDHRCGGEEHDATVNPGVPPSYCTLPIFHPLPTMADVPPTGHLSSDGHVYNCKDPVNLSRSFHIFFVLDRSGSMTLYDRRPLRNSPATSRITTIANNRFGAVISSLYGFWTARSTAMKAGKAAGLRRDAYSIITFGSGAATTLVNDTESSPDQLLKLMLGKATPWGGTNYTAALETVHRQMEDTWDDERYPIIIFLSDGECEVADDTVYELCRTAVRLGKPLAWHSVSFGNTAYTHTLRRMATIAGEVYESAPRDPLVPAHINPCSFSSALDTIQLASTFLHIAESLKNPRAALSRLNAV